MSCQCYNCVNDLHWSYGCSDESVIVIKEDEEE